METEEIYNIPISSLIVTPFATQWSSDNQFSVLTEKGIYIFELIPSPLSPHANIRFARSFIYPSDVLAADAFVPEVETAILKMKREERYSLLMEMILTSKIDGVTRIAPKICSVAWSPQDLIYPSKCILAILTTAGAIELLHKVSPDWYSLCNLTSHWLDNVQENVKDNFTKLKDSNNTEVLFTIVTKNIRKVQACAMAWSSLYTTDKICFAFFVVAYRSSDIAIWQIQKIACFDQIVKPKIVSNTSLNDNVKITVLHWIDLNVNEYIVIVGYFDGKVQGLKYEKSDDVIERKGIENYYSYRDHISVTSVQKLSHNNLGIKIIVSKGSFILLIHLSAEGALKNVQHLHIKGFTITGLSVLDSQRALITTQNGTLFTIHAHENSLISTEVKHKSLQASVQFLGLTHVINGTMFVNVSSPSSIYDHLIQREPSTVHIFTLKDKEWDPLYILQTNKNIKLKYFWESLEVIRIKAAKAVDPATVLPTVPDNLESLSLNDLRISMWISVMTDVCTKKQEIQGVVNIVGEISESQPLIFVHSASAYLIQLGKKDSLSAEQTLSVNLLRMYFEVYLSGEDGEEETNIFKYAHKALYAVSHVQSGILDKCNLCGEVINELPWNATKCPSGHKLPRCALTLLQVTTIKYRTCPICGQIFHPSIDNVYQEVRCLFCDVPAVYDNRVLNTKNSELYKRNMSKTQSSVTEVLTNEELETLEDHDKD